MPCVFFLISFSIRAFYSLDEFQSDKTLNNLGYPIRDTKNRRSVRDNIHKRTKRKAKKRWKMRERPLMMIPSIVRRKFLFLSLLFVGLFFYFNSSETFCFLYFSWIRKRYDENKKNDESNESECGCMRTKSNQRCSCKGPDRAYKENSNDDRQSSSWG